MIQYATICHLHMAFGSTSSVLHLFSHELLGTWSTVRLAIHGPSLAAVDRPCPTRPSSWSTFLGAYRKRCSFFIFSFFVASVIILPFAVRASSSCHPVMLLSCSCHAPVMLSKFTRHSVEVAFDSRAPDRLTALCSFEDCHCSICIRKRSSLCKNHWSSWHMIINWCFMKFSRVRKQNRPCRPLSLMQAANGLCVAPALHFRIFWGSTAQSAFV